MKKLVNLNGLVFGSDVAIYDFCFFGGGGHTNTIVTLVTLMLRTRRNLSKLANSYIHFFVALCISEHWIVSERN